MAERVEYWKAMDGQLFLNEMDCYRHEVEVIEEKYGIKYYGYTRRFEVSFNEAWVVLMPKEMPEEDYGVLRQWYNWTVPNEEGKYLWNDESAEWDKEVD